MAWRQIGDKPLTEPITVNLLTHICVTRPQWVNPHVATFAARLWVTKRRDDDNLQYGLMVNYHQPAVFFLPSSCKSRGMWIKCWCSVNANMLFCGIQIAIPGICAYYFHEQRLSFRTAIGFRHVGPWRLLLIAGPPCINDKTLVSCIQCNMTIYLQWINKTEHALTSERRRYTRIHCIWRCPGPSRSLTTRRHLIDAKPVSVK